MTATLTHSSRKASGIVPMGWQRVRLGEIAERCLGKMLDAKKNKGKAFPYLRNPNVKWFSIDLSDLREMPFEDHELDRFGVRRGDVLICEGGEAGRAAIWESDRTDVKIQKAIHRVRCGPELHNRFLVHRLMFDYFSGRLNDYYTGTTIKHLTGQDLAKYEFLLPPLSEQKRIAGILDAADALRAKGCLHKANRQRLRTSSAGWSAWTGPRRRRRFPNCYLPKPDSPTDSVCRDDY